MLLDNQVQCPQSLCRRIRIFSADLNVFAFEVLSHYSGEVPLHFCVILEVPGGSFGGHCETTFILVVTIPSFQ